MLNLIDRKIRHAFSNAALQYDVLTSLHKEIGRELMKKVLNYEELDSVLDVGMGTGWLTRKLSFYLPDSRIIGLDFAEGMIDAAQRDEDAPILVQADAMNLPFKQSSFDMIVSNLAYQWMSDLTQCFQENHRVLNGQGRMMLTLFGHDTFKDLFAALDDSRAGKEELRIHRLPHQEQVKEALSVAGFQNFEIDFERIQTRFSTMMYLVKWIKNIGANALPRDFFVGKELLQRAEEYYHRHYQDRFGITATFEVIWVKAEKG